jgi:hypothetical protein
MTLKLNMLIINLHKPIQQALVFNNLFSSSNVHEIASANLVKNNLLHCMKIEHKLIFISKS